MGHQYQDTNPLIFEAVRQNKWDLASKTFEDHPELRTNPINRRLETPLMIAVGTNRSHDFVKNLLSSISKSTDRTELAAENDEGDTALHYAAKIGNLIDAKLLIEYSSNPDQIILHENKKKKTPLLYAALLGRNKEMFEYLYSLMGAFERHKSGDSTQRSSLGPVLTYVIDAGFHDIALKLVETYSNSDEHDSLDTQRSLSVLARKPELFPTGGKLGFWSRCIYKLLHVDESKNMIPDEKTSSQLHAHDEEAAYTSKEDINCTSTTAWIKRIFQYLASPLINNIYDLKQRHQQTMQLVKRLCTLVIKEGKQEDIWTTLGTTIITAVEFGNYEVLEECISSYPSVIWSWFGDVPLFQTAIKQRQEKVYNFVYQRSSYKAFGLSHIDDKTNDNILHIAAKLAPSDRLSTITGAALQMQRELQWFKEIESLVEPSMKREVNKKNKTPIMVFNDEHKDLLKEGKEWMKDTASSSTVVAALIVTVAFAAVFTLPGGEENRGKFAFTLFIISDAIALFSSATSTLLLLGILTSRYAENDFLHVLPRRLMGGLFSLFLSLAATMIAFSATLALVLQDEGTWIAAPLVIITSIPVGLFVLIQFPLLIELFCSTYGPSIFSKHQDRMIH